MLIMKCWDDKSFNIHMIIKLLLLYHILKFNEFIFSNYEFGISIFNVFLKHLLIHNIQLKRIINFG